MILHGFTLSEIPPRDKKNDKKKGRPFSVKG
jgi:hypothetical protein